MAASTMRAIDFAQAEVSWGRIKAFCSMIEDPNPSYWDADFATTQWGGIVSPPALMYSWVLPLAWRPDGSGWDQVAPLPLRVDVPGEELLNVGVESRFTRPIRVGENLVMDQQVVDVSEEKQTRVGLGHFVTTLATFYNQRGEVVGTDRNTLLRYTSPPEPLNAQAPPPQPPIDLGDEVLASGEQRYFEDISEGDPLSPITLDVTFRKVAMIMGTTADLYPGHHDPEFARAQGQENIFINTVFFQGFIDRLLTSWAGPRSFITARTFRMTRSIYPGDTMYARGTVKAARETGPEAGLIDVEVEVGRQDGPCAGASTTIRLPRRSGA